MSKVILVFEKPETCGGCPCMNMRGGFVCQEEWRDVEDPDHVPMWCPLKPLPSEIIEDEDDAYHILWFKHGYNTCVQILEGEKNESNISD